MRSYDLKHKQINKNVENCVLREAVHRLVLLTVEGTRRFSRGGGLALDGG